jgi:DNA polymerase-4
MNNRTVLHIDVNSAYLSWEAIERLEQGNPLDLREIDAIIGGNPKTRRGIVLAKSIPAKRFGIQTGETLHTAFQKCPHLTVVPPNYALYMRCSDAMKALLESYVPKVQRFSVDEFFIELTQCNRLYGNALDLADLLRKTIKNELGFTVNIGISSNKLLAKIASDFVKPDRVHTLYLHELQEKLWPLPVSELYMVGRRTLPKLLTMGIHTIGDLATTHPEWLFSKLKTHGLVLHDYANGIESTRIQSDTANGPKGIGNSTTIPYDIETLEEAQMILLSLTESVCARLRAEYMRASLIGITIKYADFTHYSHQRQLDFYCNQTTLLFEIAKQLLEELWDGNAIRHLGIRISKFQSNDFYQYSLLDPKNCDQLSTLDYTIDTLRMRFGKDILKRGCFANSPYKSITGGTADDADYPMMSSFL